MRRTGPWLCVTACSVLSACGPTIAADDASTATPDATGRPPPPPPVDAGRPDVNAGPPPNLLISEVRSRGVGGVGGVGGAADEFVELYNPSTDPVTLDSSW